MKKCCFCGADGMIHSESGLFYARCSKCTEHRPYAFLGMTAKTAAEQWDCANNEARTGFRSVMSAVAARRAKYVYSVDGEKQPSMAAMAKRVGRAAKTIGCMFVASHITEGSITYNGHIISREFRI